MKTLVFCTAFASDYAIWNLRYKRWFEALRKSGLKFDQILIVDDGSPVLPDWPEMTLMDDSKAIDQELDTNIRPLVFYHFSDNLGRKSQYDFPGWFRSFAFAAKYALVQGFEKVVHVESDAYLISPRMIDYLNAKQNGWSVMWCPKHSMPEIAIQIIADKEIERFEKFTGRPYSYFVGMNHEWMLPYTDVERTLKGDRYGEYMDQIPDGIDYASQVSWARGEDYYWWLPSKADSGNRARRQRCEQDEALGGNGLVIEFGKAGNSEAYVGKGWSYAECEYRWMIDDFSEIFLPPLREGAEYIMDLELIPHFSPSQQRQRLIIEINGIKFYEKEFNLKDDLRGIPLSATLFRKDENLLTVHHPDSVSPASLGEGKDSRRLAFSAKKLVIRNVIPHNDL